MKHTRNEINDFAGKVARHLQVIYKKQFGEEWVNQLISIADEKLPAKKAWDEQDILLITYGNSIYSGNEVPLKTLKRFMDGYLNESITNVHILPFFPYTSDDGFSVSDFMTVNPGFGNWNDIRAISEKFGFMCDLVINHVSSKHPWFQNFLTSQDPGKDYFIQPEAETDYSIVIRPRSTPLFTSFETKDGIKRVWTTFSADQVDLNFSNPAVLIEMIRILVYYIRQGARFIRLDAIAFLWKRKNTPCLHLNETHEVVRLLRTIASYVCPGTILITETNVPNKENWSYFGTGDEAHMVYQFSLPPLLLHTFFSENSSILSNWAEQIPETFSNQTFLNYTASHDGIGVRPLEGLLEESELARLIEGMVSFGGMISMKTNTDGSISPYEINISYFDAMKGTMKGVDGLQEQRFLCAQTIMLGLKGIPAFYIHSLLSTSNDYDGVQSTGRARSINRKQLLLHEVEEFLNHDTIHSRVFSELKRRIQIRMQCSAFHPSGHQKILISEPHVFAFIRYSKNTGAKVLCISNISGMETKIPPNDHFLIEGEDLLSDDQIRTGDAITLKPYQTRWIKENA